jgi:glycine cleavage system H protein
MKEIGELRLPDDLLYAKDHEWIKRQGDKCRIGISDYAQDQLGDIVFVELPKVGDALTQGAEFGVVESVKAVAELYMPISGEIVALNSALEDSPELVNQEPYEGGWMIEIVPADPTQLEALMNTAAYLDMLKGLQ